VPRKRIALLIAAILLPGGLVLLLLGWLARALARTKRGQRALQFVRSRTAARSGLGWLGAQRRAA
jgi:hypothetical protein